MAASFAAMSFSALECAKKAVPGPCASKLTL
ncbi:MAG: hypothetical protein QOJ01_328 [Solirubrobacterales bacterium]|nr:hypothetical protein [Solirubrobacterales bacterium]